MVDATIKMVVNRLAPYIERRVRDEVDLVRNYGKEATNLASKLKRIQEVLEAAEKKRVAEPRVKAWLERIVDAAYEIDDVLDQWEMKERELLMEGSEDDVSEFWEKVSSFIQSHCLCFKHFVERRHIALKIKELNGRLELIAKDNEEEFKFLPNLYVESDRDDSQEFKPDKTTSFVDGSKVKGRDDVKNSLVSKLLSEGSQQGNNIQIIAIVGTGGLGKTTLAQLAFGDSKVKQHFSLKAWICVSDPFDEIKIAKAILTLLEVNFKGDDEFETLLQRIEGTILGKSFLLVLDDVWTEDEEMWTPLKVSLSKCAPGSRILVTTRKVRVAEMMGAHIQPLDRLSDSDCWYLMSEIAFQGGKKWNSEILESIGMKIAKKKCDGLPRVAKTFGSLLHQKDSVEDWRAVLKNEMDSDIARENFFAPIYLNYNELRPSVRRCFSYCAILPKDSEIKADTLIKMWMAHGFLSSGSAREMEQIGREYLKDLVVRSFFRIIKVDEFFGHIVSCKMPDIVHAFAQFVTKGECFILETVDDNGITPKEEFCPRHLAWRDGWKSSSDPFSIFGVENLKKLRSFLCECCPPPWVLRTLECVRVLSLSGCRLKELPPVIGSLIHLRYLDLTENDITELPKTLCGLYNLQTLILEGCFQLSQLPEDISKLIYLRHILVSDVIDLWDPSVCFPQGLEKLTGLRTLNCFKAGIGSGGSKLGYLKNLNQLEGRLRIIIDNLNEESDALNAQLKNKNRLETLELFFFGKVSMDVMEALEPPSNLSRLRLVGLGSEFPRWIKTSLNNLKALHIDSCSSLPPLGNLHSLEKLTIGNMTMEYLRQDEFLRITDRRAAAFPKLKQLRFLNCYDWTEWEDIREEEENDDVSIMHLPNLTKRPLPELRRLEVQGCPQLKSLPHRLLRNRRTSLEYLNIYKSDLIIQQYEYGKLGDEFLSPTCQVDY